MKILNTWFSQIQSDLESVGLIQITFGFTIIWVENVFRKLIPNSNAVWFRLWRNFWLDFSHTVFGSCFSSVYKMDCKSRKSWIPNWNREPRNLGRFLVLSKFQISYTEFSVINLDRPSSNSTECNIPASGFDNSNVRLNPYGSVHACRMTHWVKG